MIRKNNYIVQKWFGNEEEALGAFYQKKLTIHTPILVRYSMLNFTFKIEKKHLKFIDKITFLKTNEKEIFLYKIFQIKKNNYKYYLITNIGVLVAYATSKNKYTLTDLFLETTPGRLIFSINFKNLIKK